MTLNLNAGEYEGGALRFPEYGPDLYSPATGDAVIFSCTLLHEAMPVTRGRRFVLLSFLFDEESRRQNDRFRRPGAGPGGG
jgi:predicted 2-oxoglutarate/Fe(II)-dependent dioxygenase YbiX